MPEASPTMNAAEKMSLAPARNSLAILLAPAPDAMPLSMARARNRALISGIYHLKQSAPMTRYIIVNARRLTIK